VEVLCRRVSNLLAAEVYEVHVEETESPCRRLLLVLIWLMHFPDVFTNGVTMNYLSGVMLYIQNLEADELDKDSSLF